MRLQSPVLSLEELERLRSLDGYADTHRAATLAMLFPAEDGGKALEEALEDLFVQADAAIAAGASVSFSPTAASTPSGRRFPRCSPRRPCTIT